MPLWQRLITVVLSLLFIVALLFFSLALLIGDVGFFAHEYETLDNAKFMGMSTEDLTAATMQMIRYMQGKVESIDIEVEVFGERVSMFNDQERVHMVDVRVLYLNWKTASWIFLALYVAMLVLVIIKRRKIAVGVLAGSFLSASVVFAAIVFAIGAWVLIDFNSFWNNFHYLFFSNDLWLFDPSASRMINMMPLELFYDVVAQLLFRFVLPWVALILACMLAFKKARRTRVELSLAGAKKDALT
ncbi:TIGR01906 family membrane protein [Eubacteriales bacterium OttesenSCG-928-K08]|nr:TIGR01906 family membrane protein [Eubacteriales bacterium OttesenSCG-928-K08]